MAGADFFERQDRARRHTWLLVLYLTAAVALITVAVVAVAYPVAVYMGRSPPQLSAWLHTREAGYVAGGVVVVVLVGSLVRLYRLRGGGRAVAELVGAVPVDPGTRDPALRRYMNVVQEMSIASGTPVPELYVLEDEQGINAFVAGYRPTEAVMVATRGAVDALARDELQGVVGHEFSHILNGDMRLNVRLIAILAGILAIALIGRAIIQGALRGGRSSSSRNSNGGPLIVAGIALVVIGYIGVFFGNLIKAAVSRQREYLADAASVQFTRNPGGIAGALWRIAEHSGGSLLASSRCEEASHMCFGQSGAPLFGRLLATHPPIRNRINAVDPHFFGKQAGKRIAERQRERTVARATAAAPAVGNPLEAFALPGGAIGLAAAVGTVSPEHLDRAVRLRASLPRIVTEALGTPSDAVLLVHALLLPEVSREKLPVARALLAHQLGEADAARVCKLRDALGDSGGRGRLMVLDLAMPALRRLDEEARQRLLDIAGKLTRVDGEITVFEASLAVLLERRLRADAGEADAVSFRSFAPVLRDLRVLLSLLARAGAADTAAAAAAFRTATLGFASRGMNLAPPDEALPEHLGGVLDRLSGLAATLKRPVVQACADCVLHDGRITDREYELVRAVCSALDCPLPPLVEPAAS